MRRRRCGEAEEETDGTEEGKLTMRVGRVEREKGRREDEK